jgi:hypothetical protein
MLEVNCPSCRKLLQVADTAIDRDSQCPACATVFRPAANWHEPPTHSAFPANTSVRLPRVADADADDLEPDTDRNIVWPTRPIEQPVRSPSLLRLGIWGFVGGALFFSPLTALLLLSMGGAPDVVKFILYILLPGIIGSLIAVGYGFVLLTVPRAFFFLGFCCYLVLSVARRTAKSLVRLKNGFFKAAGRPTQATLDEARRRRLSHYSDLEDRP